MSNTYHVVRVGGGDGARFCHPFANPFDVDGLTVDRLRLLPSFRRIVRLGLRLRVAPKF